jgi:hypothetical protein
VNEDRTEKLDQAPSPGETAFHRQQLEKELLRLREVKEHREHELEKRKVTEALCDHVYVIWNVRWREDNPDDGRYALLNFYCQKCLAQRETSVR